MSPPLSLCSFITLANTQGANAAVVTVPDIKMMLLTEEQQAQRDADDLVKVLKEANCKREELANKRWDMQAAREKHKAEQREADVKVRGKLLANTAVAEVWRQVMRQVEKVRLVAERLQTEWEASWSPWKVWMKLGVSFFLLLHCLGLRRFAGYRCTHECGSGLIEMKGVWVTHVVVGGELTVRTGARN